jgi:hypothetical protein
MSKKKLNPEQIPNQNQNQSLSQDQNQNQSLSQDQSQSQSQSPPLDTPQQSRLPLMSVPQQEQPQLPEPERVPKRRGRPPKRKTSLTESVTGGAQTIETEGLWIIIGAIITSRLNAPELSKEEIKALGTTTDAVLAKYLPTSFEYAPELALASTVAMVFLPRVLGAQKQRQKRPATIPIPEPLLPAVDEELLTEETTIPFTSDEGWR